MNAVRAWGCDRCEACSRGGEIVTRGLFDTCSVVSRCGKMHDRVSNGLVREFFSHLASEFRCAEALRLRRNETLKP